MTELQSYDLIINHTGRIIFHDWYTTPQARLSALVSLLTASDLTTGVLDRGVIQAVARRHEANVRYWTADPDTVVAAINEELTGTGVSVHLSTTRRERCRHESAQIAFSVITDYGEGRVALEHYDSRTKRAAALLERAQQFFGASDAIPAFIRRDEQRLAVLVGALIHPATVSLAEATYDPAAKAYRPVAREGFPPEPGAEKGERSWPTAL